MWLGFLPVYLIILSIFLRMAKQVLIVKMSALGDVLHTLPALTDAVKAHPGIQFDWICEEPFRDIARLHPAVRKVLPHGRLRWKKKRLAKETLSEQYSYYRNLRRTHYDAVIDAQGRIKSARVGWLAKGPLLGLDKDSATDSETAIFYKQGYPVARKMNAVERIRLLFAQALGYEVDGDPDFGIRSELLAQEYQEHAGKLVLLHGTTWQSKHWPENNWLELLNIAKASQQPAILPWGNINERERAERLVAAAGWGEVLPKLSLWDLSGIISRCSGAVGVDTGLMHIAAATGIPTVSIFGSTSVELTGARGAEVDNLGSEYECAPCLKQVCPINAEQPPCYSELPATVVWQHLQKLMKK